MPKRGDIEENIGPDDSPGLDPGAVSESTESGEGPHFTIPSQSAITSPAGPHESIRMSPVRGSRDSTGSHGWNPARASNGNGYAPVKRGVDDDYSAAQLAAMKAQNPDKCAYSLLILSFHVF